MLRRIARRQRIEIVAADAALHLGKARGDLVGLAGAEIEHVAEQGARAVARIEIGEIARHLAEAAQRAVGERRLHRQRVVAHGAVAQRAAAAGIVAGHAADGGARGRGDVDRKPQAVLLELAVEVVEHDAGLDHAGAALDVERQDAVQVLREIDHEAVIDGLAALRGAAAARGDLQPVVAGDRQRPQRLVHGPGHDHAGRHDLVERGVGGVAAAAEAVEQDVAGHFRAQAPFERGGVCHPWSRIDPARPSLAELFIISHDRLYYEFKMSKSAAPQGEAGASSWGSVRCSIAAARLLRRCWNRMSLSSLAARRRSASRMASCSRIASAQRCRLRAKLAE